MLTAISLYKVLTVVLRLHPDLQAAGNAFTLPWSNGQVEGQINKLKTIKRQMYGQASFKLLRKRIHLTFSKLYNRRVQLWFFDTYEYSRYICAPKPKSGSHDISPAITLFHATYLIPDTWRMLVS